MTGPARRDFPNPATEHSLPTWCRRRDGGFNRNHYTVTSAPAAEIRRFVLLHHYEKGWPAARMQFAIRDRATDELVGAIVLATPAGKAIVTKPFPELKPSYQTLVLSRMVLLDRVESNAESWACRRALKLARKRGIKGVVTYADPQERYLITPDGPKLIKRAHYGTAYQAAGAVYDGRTQARNFDVLPDGLVIPGRTASKLGGGVSGALGLAKRLCAYPGVTAFRPGADDPKEWLREALLSAGAVQIKNYGKHRYLFDLRTERERERDRAGIDPEKLPKPSLLPYPKRRDGGVPPAFIASPAVTRR